jgi:hypothetical protein
MTSFSDRHGFGNFFVRIERAVRRMAARWRRAVSTNHYRPEKHYMRGPGPKTLGAAGGSDRTSEQRSSALR